MESCRLVLIFTTIVAAVYGASIPEELVSASSDRGVRSAVSSLGVYDGEPTTIEKHPYVANLIHFDGLINCSATIVSDQWLVSSGSCVFGYDLRDLKVVVGSNDGGTTGGEKYKVAKTLVHPKFKMDDFDYDVGLVMIDGKFKWSQKVKPVKLPKTAPKGNTTMIVAGYGETGNIAGVSNGKLMQGKMTFLSHKICVDIFGPHVSHFTDRMNCAYRAPPHKTTLCKEDWATAFVRSNVFYGMFLAGVRQGFCSADAKPLITTYNLPFVKWIKDNTGALYEDEF